MKSNIGLDHIRNSSEGRIIHAVPGTAEQAPADADKAPPAAPAGLVSVVVHVEKGALDSLMEKSSG